MYYIGIDGGGTKTDFMIADASGKVLGSIRAGSLSYKHIGKEKCLHIIDNYLKLLLKASSLTEADEFCSCLALPNFGESRENDKYFEQEMGRFAQFHIHLVNDAEAGWAGSMKLMPGINLVAGTGAIAYGRDARGHSGRAGGWNDIFSDEGSCNWLGRAALSLFAKEADGRLEQGPLYSVIREHFALKDDLDVIDIYENQYADSRKNTAQLQRLLLDAAQKGDCHAIRQYEEAAYELSLAVLAVAKQLEFDGSIPISYSGGLFHAGDMIMEPFQEYLKNGAFRIQMPRYTPVQGAVLLAAEYWGGKAAASRIIETWQ